MTIQKILTEWTYRLPKGYPVEVKDYDVLREILDEMTDLPAAQKENVVRQAQGLSEQDEETTDTNVSQPQTINQFNTSQDFEQYILSRYAVTGQHITGLPSMYDAIIKNEDSTKIFELIISNNKLDLKSGVYPIRDIKLELYNIIENTIKIPNGDQSELWFSIVFNGKVAGAVAGDFGIEADIEIGDQSVSLKNYNKITFDFGSLPVDGTKLLNDFLEMAKLLTGQDISKSKGAKQINTVLNFLDNESVESQVRKLIDMGETTDIQLIRNISNRLKQFYSLSDNLDKMINAFCHIVDEVLREKVLSVDWWGMIIKSNQTLFLESADDIYSAVRCKNDRLSPAIANFHQNKLFVLGSQLSTKVTKKSQD